MVKTMVFPSSFFDIRKADEDLQEEYDAVLETGLFDVVILGYDKWFNEGTLTLAGEWTEEADAAMHVFPNVYKLVEEDTARMKIFPLHEEIDVRRVKAAFSRFMVKDYVKSVKGTAFPKFFDSSIEQDAFNQWMDVFYQYR